MDSVPPSESLPATAPAWIRDELGPFETFLHDCAVQHRPSLRSQPLQAGARLGGKYHIEEFIGRGGMGEVYRARDVGLDREVALKVAPAAAESAGLAEALRNEAKAIAALKHPHIIHINSFDVIDGRPCFDTNYIRGQDLARWAGEHELSAREIARIIQPVAQALSYAHEQGVLHRDVKPQNIYLGEQPGEGPWLIDFGLARMRTLVDRRENTGLCGTPGYIAPEVITSMGRDVDHRADIFGLGCVLYELAARRPAFVHTPSSSAQVSVSRTLLNTLRVQLEPLERAAPSVPPPLRRICEKAMAHDPADRYQDASDIARDLHRFLLDLDNQKAQDELARARLILDQRPSGTPAELEPLQQAAAVAEAASQHATGEVKSRALQMVEEIRRMTQAITASQAEARALLQQARQHVEARNFKLALAAARTVARNGYVPELHADAQAVADQAGQVVRKAQSRSIKIGGLAAVAGLVVVVGGFLIFGRGKPEQPDTSTTQEVTTPVPAKQPISTPGDPEAALPVVSLIAHRAEITEGGEALPVVVRLAASALSELKIQLTLGGSGQRDRHYRAEGISDSGEVVMSAGQREHTVSFTAVDNNIADGRRTISIGLEASAGIRLGEPHQIELSIIDNDTLTLRVDPTELKVPEGGAAAFAVSLTAEPPGPLTVSIVKQADSDPDINLQSGTSLTFAPENATTPQQVMLAAAADADSLAGTAVFELRVPGLPVVKVTATELEKDVPGLLTEPETLTAIEGKPAILRLALKTQPAADVYVLLTPDGQLDAGNGPGKDQVVKIVPSSWNEKKEITISPVDDRLAQGERKAVVTLTLDSDDAGYKGLAVAPVVVTIVDDEVPGWAADLPYARIAESLVGEGSGCWLSGYDAALIRLAPEADGALLLTVLDPWGNGQAAGQVRLDPPNPPLPEENRLAAATSAIVQAVQAKAEGIPAYIRWWPQRRQLENEIAGALGPAGSATNVKVPSPAAASLLARLARIKYLSEEPVEAPIDQRTAAMQNVLAQRTANLAVRPNRFIEYFWGPSRIHALYWKADAGTIDVQHADLGASTGELANQVRSAIQQQNLAPALGAALIQPLLAGGFLDAAGEQPTSIGLVIAPDGPLCFLPLARLSFATTPVKATLLDKLTDPRAVDSISRLDGLCTGRLVACFSAVWTVVSLGSPPAQPASPVALWTIPWALNITTGQKDDLMGTAAGQWTAGKARNGMVVLRASQRDRVAGLLRDGTRALERDLPESYFDVGFLAPRIGTDAAPWFIIVADAAR